MNEQQKRLISGCILACEAAAVESGYAPEVGKFIYDGSVADDLNHWSIDEFAEWTVELEKLYKDDRGVEPLLDLYGKVSKIMGDYGRHLEQTEHFEPTKI